MESDMPVSASRYLYERLAGRSRAALEALMLRGEAPSLAGITGYEYRGYNVAPALALLGIRKFIKAFFVTPTGTTYGCNTPVAQNGPRGPWLARPREDAPRRYAFFSVEPVAPEGRDNAYLHALLLDYGRGGNPLYDPSRSLRDYLVRCVPGSDDLLLGKAYMALGPLRIPATFFLLERHRPLAGPVNLPRSGGMSEVPSGPRAVPSRPGRPRRVALVTGCSSGFGLVTAVELARRGFRVYASMRDVGKRAPLDAAARKAGVSLSVLPIDVTSAESIASAVDAVLSEAGRIDLLVSNAGYGLGGFTGDLTLAELREQFETNFFGAVALAKAVLPTMLARRSGRLIFVSSLNGLVGFPGLAAYAASKFALEGFAESLRWEALPDGIYVSLVEPGSYPTEIFGANRRVASSATDPASHYYARSRRLEKLVLGRITASKRDPRAVGMAIARIATTARPRLRYRVGSDAGLALVAHRLLPDRLLDGVMRRIQQ